MNDPEEPSNLSDRCMFNKEFKYILWPISYTIVFVFGIILNVLALYIFIFRIQPWKVVNIFIFNLALSDLLYVLSLPLLAYLRDNDWLSSKPFSKLPCFLFYTSLHCSILFLLCISIYRFLVVCYPKQLLRCRQIRYARTASVGIWATVIILQSPIFSFISTSQSYVSSACQDTSNIELLEEFVIYSTVNLVILFCIPFTANLVCCCYIIHFLIKPMISNSHTSTSKTKSIKIIVTVLLVIVIFFLPFHNARTLYYFYLLRAVCGSMLF